MKTVCFVNPRLLMFVVMKVSETPTVEGLLNSVLRVTQSSILVFTSLVSINQMHWQGDSLIHSLSCNMLFDTCL